MAGVSGIPALDKLRLRFVGVQSASFRNGLGKAMADAAEKQVKKQFDQGKDPYGRKWKKLKKASERAPRRGGPLVKTGALSKSFKATNKGFSFSITGLPYGIHHQYGAPKAKVPRRQILPMDESGGLGKAWRGVFDTAYSTYMRKHFSR